ncbi:MAG: hypothetical protein IK051_06435 [Rhodocyclaceae bacterium]|nr:hypothetical protein [Rhodocyclaceae bacterium]
MKLQRYALLSSLAASLILAACGGGDGEGDYSDTGSGGNSGTPGVKEDWKEYKTISPRCPMGTSVQQDNIHCLRGVFRGKSDYGQACEVDFMGENGFRLTVDGNPYTYLPNAALKLDEYNHYTSNQYLVDSLIAEKQLYANLNYTPSSTVIFDLVDGKYDANHWRRLGKDQDVNYVAAFVLFTHFPKEMGASLNIPGAGFETNFTCRIESVLYH